MKPTPSNDAVALVLLAFILTTVTVAVVWSL